jgi:hypothetical protein
MNISKVSIVMSTRQNSSSQTKNVLRVIYVPRNMMKLAADWLKGVGAKAVSRRTDLDDVSADKYAISYTSREDAKGKFVGAASNSEQVAIEEPAPKEKKVPKEEKKEERPDKKTHRSETSRSESRHRDSDGKKERRESKH